MTWQMADNVTQLISDYKACFIFVYEYGSVRHTANSLYFKIKDIT